jgi:hypothetical protein
VKIGSTRKAAKPIAVHPRGRRLKGLDEFETPEFVGRMERVERRQKLTWYAMLSVAVVLGAGIGLTLF